MAWQILAKTYYQAYHHTLFIEFGCFYALLVICICRALMMSIGFDEVWVG